MASECEADVEPEVEPEVDSSDVDSSEGHIFGPEWEAVAKRAYRLQGRAFDNFIADWADGMDVEAALEKWEA